MRAASSESLIPRLQVPLVHLAQRREQIALLFRLHALRAAEIQDRIAARAERRSLVRGGQEALTVDGGSRANTAFQQHHEAGQILVLTTEPVEDPGTEARTADPRPPVVDQELRLRMREAFVVAGADYREIIDAFRRYAATDRTLRSRTARTS